MAAEPNDAPLTDAEADRLLAPVLHTAGIGVAVSGGADSVALLRLLAEWRDRTQCSAPVAAFTVDHCLREGSAQEARQVAAWAAAVGISHEILTWKEPRRGSDIQAAARQARYRLLAEACTARGFTHLLTAHHLDDQAETLLLRLARGSGVDGLSAMSARTGWPGVELLRPLLDVPKRRLVATLQVRGQAWIEDPSNSDPRFARARLRALMPELASKGLTPERLAATARRMQRARSALEAAAGELHAACVKTDPAGFARLDGAPFASAPEEIGMRVLARLLMAIGGTDYPPRLERLERLYGLVASAGDGKSAATLNGCRVTVSGDSVLILRESGRAGLPESRMTGPGTHFWDRRFRIVSQCGFNGDLTVRALGREGISEVHRRSRLRAIPAAAALVAPGVFAGDRLVAAPLVEAVPGPYSPIGFAVTFVGVERFAGGVVV